MLATEPSNRDSSSPSSENCYKADGPCHEAVQLYEDVRSRRQRQRGVLEMDGVSVETQSASMSRSSTGASYPSCNRAPKRWVNRSAFSQSAGADCGEHAAVPKLTGDVPGAEQPPSNDHPGRYSFTAPCVMPRIT